MFGNPHFERLRQTFEDQFEGSGAELVYRKNRKAAPVRVTEAERDTFVAAYVRASRYLIGGAILGTVALIGGTTALSLSPDDSLSHLWMFGSVGTLMAAFLALHSWVWEAPERALDGRLACGAERAPAEMKRIFFARITYGQLAFGAAAAVFMLFNAANQWDVRHGWGRLWVVAAAGLIVLTAVQAVRKWRVERAAKRP